MEQTDALESVDLPELPASLLSENSDPELDQIVQAAASMLSAPMAIVTLVAGQIQFFRAHHGLPAQLAAAGLTSRRASFCQFVVRDDAPFEVRDAKSDDRVPKLLVDEFGVGAYLGVPIHNGDRVVGSLCVIDTEARDFDQAQRDHLANLAEQVDRRLVQIASQREQTASRLAASATVPALAELRRALQPLVEVASTEASSIASIRALLKLADVVSEGSTTSRRFVDHAVSLASDAIESIQSALFDVGATASDALDCVSALEHLRSTAQEVRLPDVLLAAQDLTRPLTERVGGLVLPAEVDRLLAVPSSIAIGLVATTFMLVSNALLDGAERPGIRVALRDDGARVSLRVDCQWLEAERIAALCEKLSELVAGEPGVSVFAAPAAAELRFAANG